MSTETLDEARRLVEMINVGELKNKREQLFVLSMRNYVEMGESPDPKQIYWLRDIKDKQLEGD